MEIKDIQGNILIDALVTEQAVKVDELMKQHSITLSWVSVTDEQLPLGAYIEHEGVRYSLLAPYNPEQSDEATYTYKPVFEHPIMRWQHIPFFFYTYSEGKVISKELDWSLTDNPANFMKAVCDAILNETGEDWSYEISADLPASASQSFSNTDIFSALNAIAGAFETEWWFDYANKIVYLSKAAYGYAVTLEVGQNIGVPSKNQSKEGYYTRFYAFGSTRNIEQSYAGSNVNSIVNRRLTLNPEKYPNGYIDIREGLTESEILVKTLMFDDIYPRSSLTISDVKVRLMWRLDDNSEKVQIGTDSEGNPVYDQYAIWYFKIPELSFSKDMLIEGKALSVHFNSGALNGREFELTYHDTAKEVTTSDGTSIQVEVGDYEINFIEEGTYIIPAITGLVPMEGDSVTLFNIVMPEEYKASAYEELEQEVRKEITKQGEDRNNYTFDSNKVAFFESNPNLAVGRNVLYKNGSTTLATRVIRLETQLDYAFEQKITIGNEQIKGNTQTLKEEVVNANQSIDLLAAINENTEAFQQSLQRTQKAVLDSLAKWGDMWVLDPANGAVRTRYNVIAEGTIAMKDLGGGGSGEVAQGNLDNLSNVQISNPSNGDVLTYDEVNDIWVNKVVKSGLDETELKSYLTTNQYAKLSDIPSLDGYALASDLTALRTDFNNLNTLLNGNVGGVIDSWNEVVSFLDGYSQSDDLATILSGMNSDIANRVLYTDFEKLEDSVSGIAGYFTNGSANNALKLGGQLPSYYATADALNLVKKDVTAVSNRVKTFEDVIGIDSNGDVYIKGTRNFYTAGGTISMFGLGDGDSGEVASVAIKFEGSDDVYSAVEGIITLPAYPSGGGVADSVAWSNVTGKPNFSTVATSGQYSDLNGLPTIPTNNNQLTNGAGYITSSALNGYAKLTDIPSSLPASDVYAWAKKATLAASDVPDLSGKYLPLSGGILQADSADLLVINRLSSTNTAYIAFKGNNSLRGKLGFNADGLPIVQVPSISSNNLFLIHSGNIGSQSVNYANSAGNADTVGGISSSGLALYSSDLKLDGSMKKHLGYSNTRDGFPINGGALITGTTGYAMVLHGRNGVFRFNTLENGSLTGWKFVAFTDSNVASATKLQTARTIWGQSFDGTANVSGILLLGNGVSIQSKDSSGANRDIVYMTAANQLVFGAGAHFAGGDTYIGGNALHLRYGTTPTVGLTLKNSGNVLIGTTTDNGAKLQVNGGITTYGSINLQSVGEIKNALAISRYDNGTGYYVGSRNAGLGVADGGALIYTYGYTPISFYTYGSERMRISGNGDVSIYGNLVATGTAAMGTLSSSSDARLKSNIELLTEDESLAVLRQLRPSKWNWKSNGALSYGFIAQEVEEIASCMVDRMNDEELGQKLYLQYNQLHAFEVGAIQHMDSEVEQLKRDLKTANLKIEKLENKLKQYILCQ